MPVISQKNRPIGLVLSGFSLSSGYLFSPRPETLRYTHPGRGTAIQTFDGGFVDDFGEGLTEIVARGHTGWADPVPGELRYYALRDLVTLQYHAQREAAGQAIDSVKLYWIDTLNAFLYEVYPLSFSGVREKQSGSLLYRYDLRFIGINRSFGLSDLLGGASGIFG